MNNIVLLFKSIAIGLANVVAGLSGATVAVICNIYDRLIDACSDIVRHPFKVLKENMVLFIGIFIGVFLGVIILEKLYISAPIPVSLFFSGIIISSISSVKKEVKVWDYKSISIFLISFLTIIILPLLSSGKSVVLTLSISSIIILLLLGVVSAASMIIPGISGSMVLAATGYYEPILTLLTDTLDMVLALEFVKMLDNILIIFIFGIGCIVGLVLVSKLIKKLLSNYSNYTFSSILGLVSASSIAIMLVVLKKENRFNDQADLIMWIIGFVMLLLGLYLGHKLSEYEGVENEKF